jgi:hypothetical protein
LVEVTGAAGQMRRLAVWLFRRCSPLAVESQRELARALGDLVANIEEEYR